jgi:3-hydroxy-9,10-secoandrosta-1,3,5(10)-triene-9,17-dione monooxygenase reductase component
VSVSLDPPLVSWNVARGTPSCGAFRDCDNFAIHVLSADQKAVSARFAMAIADKFDGVSWRRGLGGIPVLEDVLACFQCSRYAVHEAGDHLIVLGRVEAFMHAAERKPLVFYCGRYGHLAEDARL